MPISDALEGYLVPSGNRKPTRLFETRFARTTSRGDRESGSPTGQD